MFVVVAYNRRHSFQGFPGGSACKESACNVGDLSSIPGLGRFPGEGISSRKHPLQYSGLENSMDCIVLGFAKNQTWFSNFHFQDDSKYCYIYIFFLTDTSKCLMYVFFVTCWPMGNFTFFPILNFSWLLKSRYLTLISFWILTKSSCFYFSSTSWQDGVIFLFSWRNAVFHLPIKQFPLCQTFSIETIPI